MSKSAALLQEEAGGSGSERPAELRDGRIAGVTGVLLAGGASTRMGSNKALLPHQGKRFIEGIYRKLCDIFCEVILVTNTPEQYNFLSCRKVPDTFVGMGTLAGLHAGLAASSNPAIFAVACDMPHLDPDLIRHIVGRGKGVDMVIPCSPGGFEPLHAFYGKGCLPAMEESLSKGKRRIISIIPGVKVREIGADEVACFDPSFDSFSNINTPQEYFDLRNRAKVSLMEETLARVLDAASRDEQNRVAVKTLAAIA